MTPFRKRFYEDMQLHGLAARTQDSYVQAVQGLAASDARRHRSGTPAGAGAKRQRRQRPICPPARGDPGAAVRIPRSASRSSGFFQDG